MEVIEDGNIMDRIPILLQRDLEYYQKNQTILSENVCRGVVGGKLDFPRSASFAAVKIVLWLEEEFSIAFKHGSGMFVTIEEEKADGVAKTSDPEKFAQLATKSNDSLLEHLHMLVQEALDHADLPVLTAALGAAALLRNTLYCYQQHAHDDGHTDRHHAILVLLSLSVRPEHLHMLVQEALDHADLPVLTAALGAAALLRNTLYCYQQHAHDDGHTDRHHAILVLLSLSVRPEHLHMLVQEVLDHADLPVLTAALGAAALLRNTLYCYQQHAHDDGHTDRHHAILVLLSLSVRPEHLHMLVQEALDHADLPVLTAALGAAALLRNTLYCYQQHAHDDGHTDRHHAILVLLSLSVRPEHLHMLVQEALDHADLPVLTAALGAAALLRNTLYCYQQHAHDDGHTDRHHAILVLLSLSVRPEHLHMLVQEALDHADLPVLTAALGAAALLRNTLYCYQQHAHDAGHTDRHHAILVLLSLSVRPEHLHMLVQEALDHADLPVLTAALGAAALLRNTLYCYQQHAHDDGHTDRHHAILVLLSLSVRPEHLHMLVQEALDHADLPVLTAALGAAALLRNTLYCYQQHAHDDGHTDRHHAILVLLSLSVRPEHLHMLVQEALDHADLPVLTAALGAAALLRNTLYCYQQHAHDDGHTDRHHAILVLLSLSVRPEHLHMLVQEALDHADLPVLTAALGAAALLRNTLYCYQQHAHDDGHTDRHHAILVLLSLSVRPEHLHMLVQEALDHADLPVLTAALGAAALLRNTLYCYQQHAHDDGHTDRHHAILVLLSLSVRPEHLHMLVQEVLDHADLPVLTAALGAAALLRNTLYCYQQHAHDDGHTDRHHAILVLLSLSVRPEHLHMLVQEVLDHADLPVLTAALGAAALLRNTLYCYQQHAHDDGHTDRHHAILECYKRYSTMSEAVGERVLDLHNRVLSLYILQDSGGRPIDDKTKKVQETGTPSIQGWWLYMNGSKKDLWDTVPPKMAQRIFAGMLNETLTILTVRYCQTNTTDITTPLLINDILNILLCVAELLPAICGNGSDLAGLESTKQSRDVRDVHSKCNELFKCLVYRGSELHFLHQAFTNKEETTSFSKNTPYPWFTFVSPNLFEASEDRNANNSQNLSTKTALSLELRVLLAQPQPSWSLLVKVLMMRNCHLARMLIIHGIHNMSVDNARWPADGLWYNLDGIKKCDGFLCTADGFCRFTGDCDAGEEYARAVGALTFILVTIGSKAELKSTLCYALEVSGRDWAACLDKRQVWCDRRPPWLGAMLAGAGCFLQYVPPLLVTALQAGASMYQTISLCLTCISRTLDCIPVGFKNAANVLEGTLPTHVNPVGGSLLLQMLIIITYEEILKWAKKEAAKEVSVSNGDAHNMNMNPKPKSKHVRIHNSMTSSQSFDGSHGSLSSIALAIAEALCSIDDDHKHTTEIEDLVLQSKKACTISDNFGLSDFPDFAEFFEEGSVPASNAERESDANVLTSELLMTSAGRDSLRVIYDHLQLHTERIYKDLGMQEQCDADIVLSKAPLLFVMFHIGKMPFDQYLRKEWIMPWSKLVSLAKAWSGVDGAKVHINRRMDIRNVKTLGKNNKHLLELYNVFKCPSEGGLL